MLLRYLIVMMSVQWARLQRLRDDDRGMTTETAIITGLLAGAAILVLGIIAAAIQSRANNSADIIEGMGLGFIGLF
jgi:hypothetical protein